MIRFSDPLYAFQREQEVETSLLLKERVIDNIKLPEEDEGGSALEKKLLKKASSIIRKPGDAVMLTKLSLFLITVFLCLGLTILSQGIRFHYMKELDKNASSLAQGYAHSLSKSVEASSVVQRLLHDKLKGIASIITNADYAFESSHLVELSTQMNVDEINIYNEAAEVMLSNVEEYISWTPPFNHPVRGFIRSEMRNHVEPIRENSVNGRLYLYGYERMTDGRIVQVGITADKVNDLLGGFDLNRLLGEMLTHEEVDYVKFISTEGILLGSSDGEGLGTVMEDNAPASLTGALCIGVFPVVPEEKVYDFREPVLLSGTSIGTLIVGIGLEEVKASILSLNRTMTVALLMLYLVAVLIIYLLYDKSRKLYELAYTDETTRLPNAKFLKRTLSYELSQSPRKQLALIMVHVPRFSKISMVKGYEQGESILNEAAEYIDAQNIEGTTLFRFSEEKFMMLIKNYGERAHLVAIMEKLSRILPEQEGRGGEKRYSTLTFGALEIVDRYTSGEKVLKDVLIAMNHVDEAEAKSYGFFDEDMERNIIRENVLESELKQAVYENHADRVFLHYQPLVDAESEKVIGLEALCRMKSEFYGMVSPLEFISIAEKNGLMVDLGKLILLKAVKFQESLLEQGLRISVSVNISPIQLIQDDFVTMMMHLVQTTKMDPTLLQLEITESVFLRNHALVNSKLKVLREMGFLIAIDDFGTGYSSFSRLKELHVDAVKIDQYFIRRIAKVDDSMLITGDIIRMVHKFGLTTVAEGVENQEERAYLVSKGCDVLQGYYYGRPLPEKDICLYITEQNA